MMKRMMLSGALVLCAMVAIGVTVKVPLREGWRFVKADDSAAGTNLTIKAMSDTQVVKENTGSHVFVRMFGKGLDAMEDFVIGLEM